MKTSWTQGLTPEQKVSIKNDFNASGVLRERLRHLIQDKIESTQKRSRLENAYESPNWAYLQADARGYERALFEIISLIT